MSALDLLRLRLRDSNIAHRCKISYYPSLVVVYFYIVLALEFDESDGKTFTFKIIFTSLCVFFRNATLCEPDGNYKVATCIYIYIYFFFVEFLSANYIFCVMFEVLITCRNCNIAP